MKRTTSSYKTIPSLLVLYFIAVFSLSGQTTGSIRTFASVVEATGIQLTPLQDLVIDESFAKDGILSIAPQTDENAGKMLVTGKASSSIRLSYISEMVLSGTDGNGSLVCKLILSGHRTDNQRASLLLDQVEKVVQFSDRGEYFLWLGGTIDLSKAGPGEYDGDFTVQIEYI